MNKKSYITDIDWVLLLLYLVMVLFGWMNIFASAYNEKFKDIFNLNSTYGNQFFWIIISFLFILIIIILDYKIYQFFAYFIYGGTILLLLIVLIFGAEIHGAKSWIRFGGFTLQPSEFAKIGVALALARYLSGYQVTKFTFKAFLISAGFIALPFLLILIQPDPGTAIVFVVFILVLYREGLPGWILLLISFLAALFLFSLVFSVINILIGLFFLSITAHYFIHRNQKVFIYSLLISVFVYLLIHIFNRQFNFGLNFTSVALSAIILSSIIYIIFALKSKFTHTILIIVFFIGSSAIPYSIDYVFDNFLKPHQQKRVNIMLGKEIDTKGYGYNVNQSKIAIGSGGFAGKGFLKGTQTKLDFVPEQATDFIFCTVGEEWGFLGTALVVLLFVGLLIRIIIIAERQRYKFNRIYAYGVASVIFFHFAVNISMTIGLFPVIGIPLPFFSKGGSSLLGFTILLFILIRLDASRKAYLK